MIWSRYDLNYCPDLELARWFFFLLFWEAARGRDLGSRAKRFPLISRRQIRYCQRGKGDKMGVRVEALVTRSHLRLDLVMVEVLFL